MTRGVPSLRRTTISVLRPGTVVTGSGLEQRLPAMARKLVWPLTDSYVCGLSPPPPPAGSQDSIPPSYRPLIPSTISPAGSGAAKLLVPPLCANSSVFSTDERRSQQGLFVRPDPGAEPDQRKRVGRHLSPAQKHHGPMARPLPLYKLHPPK